MLRHPASPQRRPRWSNWERLLVGQPARRGAYRLHDVITGVAREQSRRWSCVISGSGHLREKCRQLAAETVAAASTHFGRPFDVAVAWLDVEVFVNDAEWKLVVCGAERGYAHPPTFALRELPKHVRRVPR